MSRILLIAGFLAVMGTAIDVARGQAQDSPPLAEPANSSASPSEASPNLFHHGWAGLVDGMLTGRAMALTGEGPAQGIAGAEVALLKQTQVIQTTVADADGNFVLSDMTPGIYGITVTGERSFAAHSFEAFSMPTQLPPLAVYVASLPRGKVDEVLQSLWAPDSGADGAAIPFEDAAPRGVEMQQSPRVSMSNGMVSGEVAFENPAAIPARHFLQVFNQQGELVATGRVDALGKFSFTPPGAGLFNIIVGGNAYACIGVRIVDEELQTAAAPGTRSQLVSRSAAQRPAPSRLVIAAIGPPPLEAVLADERLEEGLLPPGGFPIGGGGFAGGGFGGGGFGGAGGGAGAGLGGGAGGLGGLLGIAGLAAGAVALADDDEEFNFNVATPISN